MAVDILMQIVVAALDAWMVGILGLFLIPLLYRYAGVILLLSLTFFLISGITNFGVGILLQLDSYKIMGIALCAVVAAALWLPAALAALVRRGR